VRIGSLFSGYGGLDLGVQAVLGGEVAWHVEYDKAPSRILAHHYPDIPNLGDVTTVDFTAVEPVDVLTGGYPCQPFSHAGKRKGTDDERHLWPHVLRALREMAPRLAILENVRGHLSLGFDVVLADLADLGWSAEWGVVRASDAGAPHQRARLFIVAYPSRDRRNQRWAESTGLLWGPDAAQRGHRLPADASCRQQPWPPADGHELQLAAQCCDRVVADTQCCGRERCGSLELTGSPKDAARNCQGFADANVTGLEGPQSARGRLLLDGSSTADAASSERRTSKPDHLPEASRPATEPRECVAWGDYAPAIARWEHVIGRGAPAPTEPGRTGNPRLSPRFVEWMMGLPDGWVTDPAIGISRNDQLKALGNGVVPQQAALALSLLLPRVEAVAA